MHLQEVKNVMSRNRLAACLQDMTPRLTACSVCVAAALAITTACISSTHEPGRMSDTGTPEQSDWHRDVAAPLYWTQYEYNYTHDDYIPEAPGARSATASAARCFRSGR
jgi:hypothetical protein